MTHSRPREDAVLHQGRYFVPTVPGETKWVSSWKEFARIGGCMGMNEDQTEITLTLPTGYKFDTRFFQQNV